MSIPRWPTAPSVVLPALLAVAAFLHSVGGCAPRLGPEDLHQPPPIGEPAALVRVAGGVFITEVDAKPLNTNRMGTLAVRLAPGRHTLRATPPGDFAAARQPQAVLVSHDFVAGGDYLLDARVVSLSGTPETRAILTDAATGNAVATGQPILDD